MTDIAKLGFEADTAEMRKAATDLDRVAKSADKLERSAKGVETSMSRMERQMGAVGGTMRLLQGAIVGLGLVRMGQSVTNAAIQFQKMETTLKFATGSITGAKTEIEFLRKESERLGQDFLTAGRAYSKLAAAASALGLSTSEIRNTFTGVSAAATVMGLSAYEAEGAFNALQQMLAKGKVQAEELRGQLGERIPTAIADGAAAMGMSTQQLSKALEMGAVDAREFVTKLSDYWVEKFGNQIPNSTENANIAITDFGNAIQEVQIAVARSGFLTGLTTAMETVAGFLTDPGVMEGARAFGKSIGDAFVFISENAETVLRVFAAIGGALKGATVGAVAGPQGALFGALLGGGAGALSPEILEAIFGSAKEAEASLVDLQYAVADLDNQLTEAEAAQAAYGAAAVGVASDITRIKLALLDARQALAEFNSSMSDDEFLGGMSGAAETVVATFRAGAAATVEYTKAQVGALEKLKEQEALLGITGIALARVNALTDTGAASLEDAIKIVTGALEVTTARQAAVLDLVDAIEAETLAVERHAEALKAEQEALLDEEEAAEAATKRLEDLKQARSRLITETERQIEDNHKLNEVYGSGAREVEIYTEAQRLMRQNVLLSADAARKLATDLVDSERALDKTRKTVAAFEGLFDQAFDRIGEAITQAFATGEISAVKFGDIAKGVLSEVIQFALKLSVINPLKNALSGGNLPTFDIGGLFSGGGGAAGGGGGLGGIVSSIGSGINSLFGGGPSSIASMFANSSIGGALGLSTSASTTAAVSVGGAAGEIAAGASAAGGLTSAGSALIAAAPYAAAAVAAVMVAYQMGAIGPGPTSGPVGIADFQPGRGRGNEFHDDSYTADNGGNPESMRSIAEAVAKLIADSADRLGATIDESLGFRIAGYAGAEAGNSKGRKTGIEVNAFIRGEAEKRIAEGLSETQAIFEAFNFAVREAFTFESTTLAEIARTTSAATTEELLADLEFGRTFDLLRDGLRDLGGNITANTIAQVLNTKAINERAEETVTTALAPILAFIESAVRLFPAVEGSRLPEGAAQGLSIDTSGIALEFDNGALRGSTPDYTYSNNGDEYGPVGTFTAGEDSFDLDRVSSDTHRSGTAFALTDDAGAVIAVFDSVGEALAGAGDALADYSTTLESTQGALTRTVEEQERYDANLERVGLAINIAKAQVDGLFDTIAGVGDDIATGPFATALESGNAQIAALGDQLAEVNEQIADANTAFPELSAALIDIEAATAAATTALLTTLQDDFLASIDAQINAANGNGFLNTLDTLLDSRDANGAEASALGLNVNDTAGALFSSQISNVLGDLTTDQLQMVVDSFDDAALVGAAQDLIDALSGAANAAVDYGTTAAGVLADLAVEDLIDAELALIDARRDEADEAKRLADQAGQNARNLRSAANGFQTNSSLSTLSVEDQMTEALRQFDEAYAVANDNTPGDVESQDAIQALPGLGQTALETAKAFYGSSTQYAARSQSIRDKMLSTAGAQETIGRQQLTVLESIEALLEGQGANDNNQPNYVSAGNGQYVSTGAGGLQSGLDLGSNPEANFRIARAFAAAGIAFPGAGEGQLNALRQTNPLADALLSAMQFADGGVFSMGNVIPFAKGGVVGRTTMFPIGMMGEAGPEAIMPLQRGADGGLGVRSVGRDDRMLFMLVERFDRMETLLQAIANNTSASAAEARKANIRARAA